MIKAGSSKGKKGSQKKKNIFRTRAHAHKKIIRRAIGFKRGRPIISRRTRCIKSKPGVFLDVYSMNIGRRLTNLQTLVTGGTSVQEVEVLFKKTADYILSLTLKILARA